MAAAECFDVSVYKRMLAGQLPTSEAENVYEHLEKCDLCFQVVRNLLEESIVASVRAKGPWPATAVQPVFIQDLVQKVLNQTCQELPSPMVFSCPGCGNNLKVRQEIAGQKVKCPRCGQVIQVQAGTAAMVSASVSATSENVTAAETLPPRKVPSAGVSDEATLPHANSPPKSEPLPSIPGYEVLGTLGRGGMGVVYKARHQKLNRLVALKMILAGSHADAADLTRFQTEAEAIARLQHPNIVQVHEIGEHEDKPFFSLEFCGGGSLAQKLSGTPLPARKAAELVEILARTMQAAHDQNIIHRDLKPANVLLTDAGVPKITDFGLAKKLDEAGQTQSGAIMGTPSYMAPEQAGGESAAIGPLSDVYTLGAILYECLTGRPPFKAATSLETIMQVITDEPVPPSQLQSKTPKDLETICLKCLEKSPAKRYAMATQLAEDLGRFQRNEPVLAHPVGRMARAWRCGWLKDVATSARKLRQTADSWHLQGFFISKKETWGQHSRRQWQFTEEEKSAIVRLIPPVLKCDDRTAIATAERFLGFVDLHSGNAIPMIAVPTILKGLPIKWGKHGKAGRFLGVLKKLGWIDHSQHRFVPRGGSGRGQARHYWIGEKMRQRFTDSGDGKKESYGVDGERLPAGLLQLP